MDRHPIQDILDEIVLIKDKSINMRRSILINAAFDWAINCYLENNRTLTGHVKVVLQTIKPYVDADIENDLLIIKPR